MSSLFERLHRQAGLLLLFVAALTVAWKANRHYAPPVGDIQVLMLAPGGVDLYVPWASARAFLDGKDPYRTPLGDPYGVPFTVDGKPIYIPYPPGNITFHIPLAFFFEDRIAAAQAWFALNSLAVVLLSLVTWQILRVVRSSLGKDETPPALLLAIFFPLALCTHTAYTLERGQSELLLSLFCWSALLLFWSKRIFSAIFLVAVGTLVKGYPALFGLGLGLLSLNRRHYQRAFAGAIAASALLLVPLRSYLGIGFAATRGRSELPCNNDFNHGFSEIFREISPASSASGRYVMTALSVLTAAGCCWNAWRGARGGRHLWLFFFATFSLLSMIGYSACSCPYNFTLVIPGILVFLAAAPELLEAVGYSRGWATFIALLQAVPACLMFLDGVGGRYSATGAGMVIFIALNGAVLAIAALRGRQEFSFGAGLPPPAQGGPMLQLEGADRARSTLP